MWETNVQLNATHSYPGFCFAGVSDAWSLWSQISQSLPQSQLTVLHIPTRDGGGGVAKLHGTAALLQVMSFDGQGR